LPQLIRALADENFALLKADASHPFAAFQEGRQFIFGKGWSWLPRARRPGRRWAVMVLDRRSHANYDAMLR
jgi:hypothetical protein